MPFVALLSIDKSGGACATWLCFECQTQAHFFPSLPAFAVLLLPILFLSPLNDNEMLDDLQCITERN